MKRFWLLFLVLSLSVPVYAQTDSTLTETQKDSINVIGFISSVILGVLSIPLTELAKKVPQIQGWATIVVNSVINLILMYLVQLIFGWSLFDNPTFMNIAMGTLGINQTVAAMIFELFKKKSSV